MGIINEWFIKKLDWGDYYFLVHKESEYNSTGKTELHNLDSVKPLLVGDTNIFIGLLKDWILRRFYY